MNYKFCFAQAFQKIKSIRDPASARPEPIDLGWDMVEKQNMFDFGGYQFQKYSKAIAAAEKVSIECLYFIIQKLFETYDYSAEQVIPPEADEGLTPVSFAFAEEKTNTLLLFKKIEPACRWQLKDNDTEKLLYEKYDVSSVKYIYFMFDYAYLQIIGHNDDESDPGRGYNSYSIKWFFEEYYGCEEYEQFKFCINEYCQRVKNYLGYMTVRSLTPQAQINFKKIVELVLRKYPYESLIGIKAGNYFLDEESYTMIQKQFLNQKTYCVLLGNHDFAQSFVTAEWLRDSMKKCQSKDLTAVATGYFKTIEQLLFELLCLKMGMLPEKTSIGDMAKHVKDHMEFLREDMPFNKRKFVRERIYTFKNMRNNYLHRNNIQSWEKIEEIRDATFKMLFLLLGAYRLSRNDLVMLGLPKSANISDYYLLCEYFNFHAEDLFIMNHGNDSEEWYIAKRDFDSKLVDDEYIQYSGVYAARFHDGMLVRITEENIPDTIWLAKFVFPNTESVTFSDPVKVKKIFEQGKFIGPSIAEEGDWNY